MERESEQMQASQPTLCRSGCGFYGSPATDNLCSLCYKEALKKKQQPPADARPVPSAVQQQQVQTSSPSPPPSFASMSAAAAVASSGGGSMETAQPTVPCSALQQQQSAGSSSDLLTKDAGVELDCGASGASSVTSGDLDDDGNSKLLGLDDSNSSDKDANGKKKKNRCVTCRKKVGLTGFECRCGGLYCSLHRYSDMHECSFDYRELGAQEIRRNNPVVVGEKIQKI